MADNVAITAGTGTSVAADDIGSVFYQRVKVTWGPDGTANDADIATGKPLPVQIRAPDGTAAPINANGQNTMANSAPVTWASDQSPLPIERLGNVFTVTPVLDTSAYSANDVLFIPIEIPNFFNEAGGSGKITSIEITDVDDETAVAVDLCFLDASGSLGNVNEAYAPADGIALTMVWDRFPIAAADWFDHGNFKACNFQNLGHKVRAAGSGTSLWLGGVLRSGTPTYAAATNWQLKIGVDWD